MKWTDTYEIVDELIENHSDIDPEKILFTDLRYLVFNIKGFEDDFEKCNERILVAIQATWIDELD
jgi:FeS assembly protein IscX